MSNVVAVDGESFISLNDLLSVEIGIPFKVQNIGVSSFWIAEGDTAPSDTSKSLRVFPPQWGPASFASVGSGAKEIWVKPTDPSVAAIIATDSGIAVGMQAGEGIVTDLYNREDEFRRLRTVNLTIGQQQILDGAGFETNWLEQSIAIGTSRFAEFTVPSGFKMVLALRHLNPSGDNFIYRVYPELIAGLPTYTKGTAKVDDAHNFAKTRNLRQDSLFAGQWLVRYNMTTPPAETSQIIYEPLWGNVNAGNRSVGGLENDDSYLLLNGGQKFLLESRNNGVTNPMNTQIGLQYAFIPDSRISPIPTA